MEKDLTKLAALLEEANRSLKAIMEQPEVQPYSLLEKWGNWEIWEDGEHRFVVCDEVFYRWRKESNGWQCRYYNSSYTTLYRDRTKIEPDPYLACFVDWYNKRPKIAP